MLELLKKVLKPVAPSGLEEPVAAGTEVDPVGMFHGVFMNGIVIEFRQMITGSEKCVPVVMKTF